jgi:MFS family permease
MGLYNSLNRLFTEFGWKFVFSVFIVYGVNQGMGEGWFYALQRYYFKDVMLLTPAMAQLMTAAARTPWNIKPIYGIVSESYPIMGYRRTYYVALAGVVGSFGWGLLYITSHIGSHAVGLTVLAMFLGCFANASPDVMIDAEVHDKSKEKPSAAADLLSLSSYSASICGASATLTSGFLVQYVGVSESFGLMFGSSAIMLIPSLFGWLGEKQVNEINETKQKDISTESVNNSIVEDPEKMGSGGTTSSTPTSEAEAGSAANLDKNTETLLLKIKQETFLAISVIVAGCALSLSFIVVFTMGHRFIVLFSILVIVIFICVSLYLQFNVRFRLITKVATFIFLRECFQLDTDQALFYWVTQYQHGPLIDSEFVGYMATVGFCAMFFGVAVYNHFLTQYSYRKIFVISTILCAIAPLLDFVLLKRWNLDLNIPDRVFLLIDFTINPMVRRLIYIPLCVLAAKVCPAGVGESHSQHI